MVSMKWNCILLFTICLDFQVLAAETDMSATKVKPDCSTESVCERSLRHLAKQQIPSYDLGSVIAPLVTEQAKWLQPLLLRLVSDENKDVRLIAIACFEQLAVLDAAYWMEFKELLLRYPENMSTAARKIKHPNMIPTLFGLVLDKDLDVSVLHPQWPESPGQLEVLLEQKIQQHAENQKDFECFSENKPRDSLCIKFAQIFGQLPYSNQLQLWQQWMTQLSMNRHTDEFLKLILVLPDRDFLEQLPEEFAKLYETQLLFLKKSRPTLIHLVQNQLTELGRVSAVPELVSQLKAPVAIKNRWDNSAISLYFRLAELAPIVDGSAIVSQVHIDVDDPRFSDWLILLGLTKQSGTETLIRQAWQKKDAPIDNAAALIAAAHYSTAILAKLNDEAQQHWYPPIRALATNLINDEDIAAQDMSEEQQDRRRMQFSFEAKLQMQPCAEVKYPPASPQGDKWYHSDHLENLTLRYSEPATTGYTTESVAKMWQSSQTGTEFMPLLAQWGVDRSLRYHVVAGLSQTDNSAFHFEPGAAMQLSDGWITTADNGEWGGELRYVDKTRNYQIASGNFSDIFLLENEILAVEGRSMKNKGVGLVYKLQQSSGGAWQAHLWRTLPASIDAVWQLADGQLLMHSKAGSFLLDAKGKLQMAECLKADE